VDRSSAEEVLVEMPKAPRGVECGLGRGLDLPKKF